METSDLFRYDFKIFTPTPIYIEVWGYSRGRTELELNYLKKRKKKENLYRKLGLTLIGIEDHTFDKPFLEMYSSFSQSLLTVLPSLKPKPLDLEYLLYGTSFSINNVISQLKEIVKSNQGYFPTTTQLRKIERGEGLISQIQKYGGVDVFKKIIKVDIEPKEVLWTIDYLQSELQKFNGLNYVPAQSELKERDRLDIYGGIQRNGGWKAVSQKLRVPTRREYLKLNPLEYQGKWTKDLIKSELQLIIKKLGYFPNERDLKNIGRLDLYGGIKRNGGMKYFKSEFTKSNHLRK